MIGKDSGVHSVAAGWIAIGWVVLNKLGDASFDAWLITSILHPSLEFVAGSIAGIVPLVILFLSKSPYSTDIPAEAAGAIAVPVAAVAEVPIGAGSKTAAVGPQIVAAALQADNATNSTAVAV